MRPATRGRKPLRWLEKLALWLLAFPVKIWWRTLRVDFSKNLVQLSRHGGPLIFAFWHHNLFAVGELHRRLRRRRSICAMVSASKDGEWLVELLKTLGIGAIRGSSNHGAAGVYAAAMGCLQDGCDLAITPDGPKGPRQRCKPGVARFAAEKFVVLAAVHIGYSRALTLKSWDRFRIPLPFSTITVEATLFEPEQLRQSDLAAQLSRIGGALDGTQFFDGAGDDCAASPDRNS